MDAQKIHASVGMHKNGTKNCFNLPRDVQAIVDLLNLVSSADGAPDDPLPSSPSPAELYRAILNFQKTQNDLGRLPRLSVDGHVDPHGPTLERLNRLANRAPAPFIPVLPDPTPPLGPDPNDDPNTVFAGDQFQIKMLDGTSFGEIGGFASYTFAIWDLKNSRVASYSYSSIILTAGTPVTFTGEGDWSAPFTSPHFIQVDQFGGPASHAGAGAGPLGVMLLGFNNNPFLGKASFTVNVPTGNSEGGGGEVGKSGTLSLIAGSVKVFSGP
jgi:hypothetical protein